MESKPPRRNKDYGDLIRYASMGTQIFVGLGLAVFVGLKADKWLKIAPWLVIVLPVVVLMGIIYKIAKETSPPRNGNPKQ